MKLDSVELVERLSNVTVLFTVLQGKETWWGHVTTRMLTLFLIGKGKKTEKEEIKDEQDLGDRKRLKLRHKSI